ncbi:DUF3313 domain-containing protein [Photobacterium profundum]|uniref:Outer membrane lipoprotein n=1 Tax=Photobacterium profundum 3TCK TaxID=314280 RepID=Q1Z110_9GAMM|nr:DUF3313 family protein [Photobacterium profundum]EAS42254.1 hypothetical protein P3TCK_16759 [Photobacterium profundum 3TCK]PSV64333.1 DUF3313 domain-containing protein [Photobacterium profundum]
MNIKLLSIISFSLVLLGCSSRLPTEDERQTQFIKNNDKLVEVEYIEDATGLQWVSPTVEASEYNKILINDVGIHQNAKAVRQIPERVLDKVSERLTTIVKQEFTRGAEVVDKAGANTATLNIMISRASTDFEDLQITEVLPYGALIGSAKALLGTRDRNVRILVESQLIDSQTEEVLAERVGVILAKGILENDDVDLEYEQIKETVELFTQDIVHFIRVTAYQATLNEQDKS